MEEIRSSLRINQILNIFSRFFFDFSIDFECFYQNFCGSSHFLSNFSITCTTLFQANGAGSLAVTDPGSLAVTGLGSPEATGPGSLDPQDPGSLAAKPDVSCGTVSVPVFFTNVKENFY